MSSRPMIIDVFADIVCPWCYIGERRMRDAVERVRTRDADVEITLRWQPFQLQPEMPEEGLPWRAFAEAKFGSWAQAQAAFRQLEAAAGPTFRFEAIATAPNTVDAHRLILLARKSDREWAMAEALFAAYFAEGRDLNDPEHLVSVAAGVGLKPEAVRTYLASNKGKKSVAVSQDTATRFGIAGVPFYIIDGRYAVRGAQPVEGFLEAINKVRARRNGAE